MEKARYDKTQVREGGDMKGKKSIYTRNDQSVREQQEKEMKRKKNDNPMQQLTPTQIRRHYQCGWVTYP